MKYVSTTIFNGMNFSTGEWITLQLCKALACMSDSGNRLFDPLESKNLMFPV